MRRAASWLLAVVLAAPALLGLAAPGVDVDALRCAMKCGHAVRAGAVCCPADASGPAFRTCPAADSALLGYAAAALGVLPAAFRLVRPSESARLTGRPFPQPLSAFDAPLDHVPLALS